jgi:hypothetical protein
MSELIDKLNYCVVKIEPMFNETKLSDATGFFLTGDLEGKLVLWLATNWHVLSGRHAEKPHRPLDRNCCLPNKLRLTLHSEVDENGNKVPVFLQEQFISLYDDDGNAVWYQHCDGPLIDIAVINVGSAFDKAKVFGINQLASDYDMLIEIGNEVFILGYPLGFEFHKKMPIWKRGSIACEAYYETAETQSKILIDATTRSGMSGSPVIMRAKTHYISEEPGKIIMKANATRFIGIYSSRPAPVSNSSPHESDGRHELGFVYKSGVAQEVITKGIPGPKLGEPP